MINFKYKNKNINIYSKYEDDHIYKTINHQKNFYEIKLLEKINSLGVSGTYVDVGSNIGNHTIYFALFTKANKVISIEVHPKIYEILINNITLNKSDKYYPLNCGVGDRNNKVLLSDFDVKNIGMCHLIDKSGDVEVKKLDDILIDIDDISLIKIDVEGYELKVLHGAKKIINSNKPILILECRTNKEFNEIDMFLNGMGYITDKINYAATPTYIWFYGR